MPLGLARGAAAVVSIAAMGATVWLLGAATGMRGLMAGLAFWPLLPYLLLLVLTRRPTTPGDALATLAGSLGVAFIGVGGYYAALMRAPEPPGPLVLVAVPLAQLLAGALVLGGARAMSGRRRRGRRPWQPR